MKKKEEHFLSMKTLDVCQETSHLSPTQWEALFLFCLAGETLRGEQHGQPRQTMKGKQPSTGALALAMWRTLSAQRLCPITAQLKTLHSIHTRLQTQLNAVALVCNCRMFWGKAAILERPILFMI